MRGYKGVQMRNNNSPKKNVLTSYYNYANIRYGLLFAEKNEQNEHARGKGKVTKEGLCRERRNGDEVMSMLMLMKYRANRIS